MGRKSTPERLEQYRKCNAKRYANNRDAIRASVAKYQADNKEKIAEKRRQIRESLSLEQIEEIRRRGRERNRASGEAGRARKRAYYHKNKAKLSKKSREYRLRIKPDAKEGTCLIDLVGKVFGKLTVISRNGKDQHGNPTWACVCSCGKTHVTAGVYLRNGDTKSCGCYRGRTAKSFGESFLHARFCCYRCVAKKNNREFSISEDAFNSIISLSCHYCGAEPATRERKYGEYGTVPINGIDRVDNSRGYSTDNIVACCKVCNIAKRAMAVGEFRAWVCRIHSHWASRPAQRS